MEEKYLTIDGRSFRFEVKELDIYSIDYYYDNPRINYIISKYPPDKVTSQLIEDSLASMDYTKELQHDILENGGLLESIIVANNKVVEGNTRLCAYRRLHKRTSDPKWSRIRAHVITDPVTEDEIFAILSNYHIKGKKPWNLYEKAACIAKMAEQGKEISEIAKRIGSTKPKVENMLRAYEVMRDKYLKKKESEKGLVGGVPEELKKFSYFEAFFINKNLAERASKTPGFIDEFVEWVAEDRIPRAQDVRELDKILDNKKAKKVFLETTPEDAFAEAKETLHWNQPSKVDGFYKKVDQFRDFLREVEVNKIKAEVNKNPHMRNTVKRCLKEFNKFCREIGVN